MSKKEIEQMDYEIDLFELIESLWREKVLIVAITAVITLIGLGYAMLTPPIYEARVKILPPSISDIAELQKFDILKSYDETRGDIAELQKFDNLDFSQAQIFTDFLTILKSNQLRKKFVQEEGDNDFKTFINKSRENGAFFKLQFSDAYLAAKFANKLVDLAIEQYRMDKSFAFAAVKDQIIKKLLYKNSSLISSYKDRLDKEINKLNEAYLIAKKLGIVEPRESKDKTLKINPSTSLVTEEMRYLYSQGTRALNAEIESVTQRKKNISMFNSLIDIEQELLLLNTVSFDASKVSPITIDLVAEAPDYIFKPKRPLIVLLSVVIGGFLAIIYVLILNAVRRRRV